MPVISAHPDLFPQSNGCFSLEAFHVQGSRILSRSFTIPITRAGGPAPEAGNDEEEDEEEEEVAVMVPMADMLNAAYERDNARLYADGDEDEEADSDEDEDMGAAEEKRKALAAAKKFGEGYTMITTKAIEAGEQIVSYFDLIILTAVQHVRVAAKLGAAAQVRARGRAPARPRPRVAADRGGDWGVSARQRR